MNMNISPEQLLLARELAAKALQQQEWDYKQINKPWTSFPDVVTTARLKIEATKGLIAAYDWAIKQLDIGEENASTT